MKSLLKISITLLIIFYSIASFLILEKVIYLEYRQICFFIALPISFFICWRWIPKNSFYAVLKHEMTHFFAATLCFRKAKSVAVNTDGSGHFCYESGDNNIFITLSPYFFPITAISVMIFISILKVDIVMGYIIFGAALGWDTSTSIKDNKPYQSDLKKFGYTFSQYIVIFGLVFFHGLLYSFTIGGWSLVFDFISYPFVNILSMIF